MRALDPATVPLTAKFLIEASAGTGKTYTITSLFLRLILEGYGVNAILVVTFTEAATAELRERIRRRLREALVVIDKGQSDDPFFQKVVLAGSEEEKTIKRRKLLAALSGFDEAAIWTIHGFCQRALRDHAFESGALYDAELVTDRQPLLDQVAADFWGRHVTNLAGPWLAYLQDKNITPTRMTDLLRLALGHPTLALLPEETPADLTEAAFYAHYQQAKQIWARDREDILGLLATHPTVNRRSFSRPNRARWAKEVDTYLAPEKPVEFPDDRGISKFRQSVLLAYHEKLGKEVPPPVHPFFECCDALCRYPEAWYVDFQKQLFGFARQHLQSQKRSQGIYFFDDLIHELETALTGPGGLLLAQRIRHQFTAALIDEFQDTDQSQYRIFETIFQKSRCPFFLIGDPKQSIYAFRGADIFAYLQASKDTKGRGGTLTVNWRSDPGLVHAVNTLFQRAPSAFGFKEVGFYPVTTGEDRRDAFFLKGRPFSPLHFLFLGGDPEQTRSPIPKEWAHQQIPDRVAAHISTLIADGALGEGDRRRAIGPGDIAVLVRSNRQAAAMQTALRQLGIPSVLSGSDSVFSSIEAFELGQVLQAVADPGNDVKLRNALSTDLFGLTAPELVVLQEDDVLWGEWVERFRDWHHIWQTDGFIAMMEGLFYCRLSADAPPLLLRLLSHFGGERQVTNFKHLAELLHGVWTNEKQGMAGMLRWFEKQCSEGRRDTEAHELRLESDAKAVQLVTIHKSKGLEYPVVVAPFLWDGRLHSQSGALPVFHDPAAGYRLSMDLRSEPDAANRTSALWEETAENMRLLYVALTRARHHCAVVWGPIKDCDTSALGFLLHGPGGAADYAAMQAHLKALDPTVMENDLAALGAESKGTIAVTDLKAVPGNFYRATEETSPSLTHRQMHRAIQRQWRFESYSHLVSRAAPFLPDDELGRDMDPHSREGDMGDSRIPTPMLADAPIPLADFEQGATAGSFFHSIYENIDFTVPTRENLTPIVQEKLMAYGYDPDVWLDRVCDALGQTLTCSLDAKMPELSLSRIETKDRLNELEFVFPVTSRDGRAGEAVEPKDIASVVKKYSGTALPKGYANALAALSFVPMSGFLKGFIDLVFCFQGRWYIVDYKSNFLGANLNEYRNDHVAQAMAEHHYFLQYYLYVTALHRYLSYRLPDYDYDIHMGKVYYLFIRGMTGDAAPGFSVFQDRPSRALIEGLSGIFSKRP